MTFRGRAATFFAIFCVLQLGWQGMRGSVLEELVVHDATVVPAARVINLVTPAVHVRAEGFSLHASGGGLNILNGCEGTEALFLLVAGFVVAPLSWRSKVSGFLVGTVLVFVVNQLRILALFYAYRADPAWFDQLHATIAPIVVILAVAGFFYAWLLYAGPHTAKSV